jgi:hypothetical protein
VPAQKPRTHLTDYPNAKYRDIVRSMDEGLAGSDPEFNIAVVLLACLAVGTLIPDVARETHLPRHFVSGVIRRARRERVITGKNKLSVNWQDPEIGGVAFWMDVAAVQGFLHRVN